MRLKTALELHAMFESTSARNFRKFESSDEQRAGGDGGRVQVPGPAPTETRASGPAMTTCNRSFTIQHTVHHAMTCSPSPANGSGKPQIRVFQAPQAPAFPATLAFV
jgi:hypothetical protein